MPVLGPEAELHLIDPFLDASGWALPPDARPIEGATRRAVARASRRGGPDGRGGPAVHWQIARSQDAGRRWTGGEADLVFIDGDHSPEGCREDFEVWSPHVGPGGAIAFHDAREGLPGGRGSIGPTSVVDALFRAAATLADEWRIAEEVDSLVVVARPLTPLAPHDGPAGRWSSNSPRIREFPAHDRSARGGRRVGGGRRGVGGGRSGGCRRGAPAWCRPRSAR